MDDKRLISEVEAHTILYDTSHISYKDYTEKDKAWADVAAALGAEVDDCRNRWRILRDQYVKFLRKDVPSGSEADPHPSSYKYGDIMTYLRPHIQQRRSNFRLCAAPARVSTTTRPGTVTSSVSGQAVTEGDSERARTPSTMGTVPSPGSSASPSQEVERPERSRSPRERATSGQERRRRRRSPPPQQMQSFQDRLLNILQEPPAKPPIPDTVEDEVYHFALSLIPMMLRLSDNGLLRAKIELLKCLYRIQTEESLQPTEEGGGYKPEQVFNMDETGTFIKKEEDMDTYTHPLTEEDVVEMTKAPKEEEEDGLPW